MNFSFTATNGQCPACYAAGRKWYIQDRYIGGDAYEYCLMSVSAEKTQKHQFQNPSEVAKWLNDEKDKETEYAEDIAEYIIHRHLEYGFSDTALLIKNGVQYVWKKKEHTLTVLAERNQETGWFDSYNECLNVAKKILKKSTEEQNGKQMSLFD